MSMSQASSSLVRRLPFFYGWVIIAVAFVTAALGITARTAFSLLFPPIVEEFGWDRALAAGAFSFGFGISAFVATLIGRVMDVRGPRFVIQTGVLLTVAGLLGATWISTSWQLYLTLGLLVGLGANCLGYSVHSQFLPNWFVRRRALAIGIAFAGVGVGSILVLPWMQALILSEGWRSASWKLGTLIAVVLLPINFLVRKRPEDLGLLPDGEKPAAGGGAARKSNIVDAEWVATDWTLKRAVRTARFWWLAVGFFSGGYTWYAVQVHQTKYLIEIGFSPMLAAWSLGLVALVSIPGQIVIGGLSDRYGRELLWVVACSGFAICYAALLVLRVMPSEPMLWLMVLSQGALGYAFTSMMGPIVAEIFEGKSFGTIFGMLMTSLIIGGALGPLVSGWLYDRLGNYDVAFALGLGFSIVCAVAVFFASPGKVRAVAGKL
jgi:MFS family permease